MSNAATPVSINPYLKMALDLGPLVVFFFANSQGKNLAVKYPILADLGEPIFIATALFMVATIISLTVSWILTRSLPIMPLVTGVVVLVFGGLTIYLHNDTFIKLKPTIVNTLFGTVLLVGLMFGKSLLKYAFEAAFKIDEDGWRKLTFRWGIFFFFLAALNEVIWRNFTTDFWVAFKVWGNMPLTFAFMMFQMKLWKEHELPEEGESAE